MTFDNSNGRRHVCLQLKSREEAGSKESEIVLTIGRLQTRSGCVKLLDNMHDDRDS